MFAVNHLAGLGGNSARASIAFHQAMADDSLSDGLTWFNGMSIGEPSPDRTVIVGVLANDSSLDDLFALSVGGIFAAKRATYQNAGGGFLQFWTASVPEGSTANVVVNLDTSGEVGTFCVATFSARGLQSQVPVQSASSSASPGSTSIAIPLGGFAIGLALSGEASGLPTATWGNAKEAFDAVRSGGWSTTFSGAISDDQGDRAITCQWTATTSARGLLTAAWV